MRSPVIAQPPEEVGESKRLAYRYRRHLGERFIEGLLFLMAFASVGITIAIVAMLVKESFVFFEHVSLWDFLTDTQWTPLFDDAHYGILPLISGTVVSSAVALLVAIPLGTITAIYLSEFAPFGVREAAKPFLELLGGYPLSCMGISRYCSSRPCCRKFCPNCLVSAYCPPDW